MGSDNLAALSLCKDCMEQKWAMLDIVHRFAREPGQWRAAISQSSTRPMLATARQGLWPRHGLGGNWNGYVTFVTYVFVVSVELGGPEECWKLRQPGEPTNS
jgi:hypothetical protein